MQFGGKHYTEASIVRGRRVLQNGAVAGYVRTDDGSVKWRIVKGADREAMDAIRAKRGKRVPLSRADAKKAFDDHYRRDYMNNEERRAAHRSTVNRKHPELTPRQVSIRTNKSLRKSMAAAKTRDQGHALPKHRIITDQRFKKNPRAWDYPGVDDGVFPIVHRGSSPSQKAAAKKNIQKARATDSFKEWQALRKDEDNDGQKIIGAQKIKDHHPRKDYQKLRGKRGKSGKKNQNQNQRQQNQNQRQNQNQQGGQRPVSLKSAVKLLRDYYREAY